VGYRRQLGGGEGGTKERLWPLQATGVECLRHAIRIESPDSHGPGGWSSFESLTMLQRALKTIDTTEGVVYTVSVGVYKLPTTSENNMQAGHTDSNTDKFYLGNCTQCTHKHRASVHSALTFNSLPQSIFAAVRLRRLCLSGEPTSRHTQVRSASAGRSL